MPNPLPFASYGHVLGAMFPIGGVEVTGNYRGSSSVSPPLRHGISQAALSLMGAGISSIFNLGSSIYTNWQNKKMADLQYERQRRDIAAQNAYNSPAAQVVRMRAAGINPAMAFQNGISASAGEQSAIAQYQRPEFSTPTLDSQAIVSAFTDVGRLENERKSTAASVLKMETETRNLVQDLDFKMKNQPQLIRKAEIDIKQASVDVKKTLAEFKIAVAGTVLARYNIAKAAQDWKINEVGLMKTIMMLPHEMLNMDADSALKYWQANKTRQDLKLAYAYLYATLRGQDLNYQLGQSQVSATLSGQDVQMKSSILGFLGQVISSVMHLGGAALLAK